MRHKCLIARGSLDGEVYDARGAVVTIRARTTSQTGRGVLDQRYLASLLDKARQPQTGYGRYKPINYSSALLLDMFHPYADELLRYLANSEFAFAHDALFHVGSTYQLVQPNLFVNWLLLRADSVGADTAAMELEQYLQLDCNPGWRILAVKGCRVPHRTNLGNGVYLVPYEEIPECEEKRALRPDGRQLAQLSEIGVQANPVINALHWSAPSCGLIIETESQPKYRTSSDWDSHDMSASVFTESIRLTNLSFLLGLVGSNSPTPFMEWEILQDHIPLSGMVSSSNTHIPELLPCIGSVKWEDYDLNAMENITTEYRSLSDPSRHKLDVSLLYLNQADNTFDITQKAINLGIALEALLLPEADWSGTAKMVRVLAAQLVGDDFDDTCRIFKWAYKLRSMAMHNGTVGITEVTLGSTYGSMGCREFLETSIRLTKRCARSYIERGGISREDQRQALNSRIDCTDS